MREAYAWNKSKVGPDLIGSPERVGIVPATCWERSFGIGRQIKEIQVKQTKKLWATGVVALSAVAMVQASVININFNSNDRGGGGDLLLDGTDSSMPVAYTGTTWNDSVWGEASQSAMSNLLDTAGNATTVDITLDGGSNYGSASIGHDVLKEYRYFSAGGITIDLSGLGAGSQWDIYCLSQGNADSRTTQFTIGSNVLQASPADLTSTTWAENGNYVKFASITADGAGNVSIFAESLSGNNNGSLNGIQLVAIPEPSSLGLMVVLSGGIFFLRRRFMF